MIFIDLGKNRTFYKIYRIPVLGRIVRLMMDFISVFYHYLRIIFD